MAEIDSLIAEVNKKYKTDIIRKASDLKSMEFIPLLLSSDELSYQRWSTCRADDRAGGLASERQNYYSS